MGKIYSNNNNCIEFFKTCKNCCSIDNTFLSVISNDSNTLSIEGEGTIKSPLVGEIIVNSTSNLISTENGLSLDRTEVSESMAQESVENWVSRSTPANRIWTNICWSPELRLIVVTSHSTATDNIMTSSDGITWTIRNAPNTNNIRAVAWSPKLKLFATVASTGVGNRVNTSIDGINWVAGVSAADYYFRDMIWVDELEMFIAVALTDGVTDKVMTSTDGFNWELQQCPDQSWSDIVWSPELQLLCVSATGGGASTNKIMTSPDGINWTLRITPTEAGISWEGLTWSGDLRLFVAVNFYPANGRVMTSPNGIDWTLRTVPAADWLSVAWSPQLGEFVAVGNANKLMSSRDGINWTLQTVPANNWRRILWIEELGIFVVVAYYSGGAGGQLIMTSKNLDTHQQYLNIYGRNTTQQVKGGIAFPDVLEYADNATALVAGLIIGQIYRTGDLLKIVH